MGRVPYYTFFQRRYSQQTHEKMLITNHWINANQNHNEGLPWWRSG